jgi:DNA mismatch repair protein MSH6
MGGGKKLHVGFPEKVLDKYLAHMVNAGYKVAVVEQTETPREMDVRLKAARAAGKTIRKQDKAVHREMHQMVTRGTFRNKDETYEQKFMLAFARYGSDIGVCFFDCTTLQIYLGQFEDDESLSALRTLSSQIRPVEIIHEREFSTSDIVKMLKNSP